MKKILSINGYQTSVGGAFYDPSTRSLMILEDTQDSTKFDLIIAGGCSPSITIFERVHC